MWKEGKYKKTVNKKLKKTTKYNEKWNIRRKGKSKRKHDWPKMPMVLRRGEHTMQLAASYR
jgi:hypothetical protein